MKGSGVSPVKMLTANLALLHLIVFSCFCQNSQHWGYKMMDEIPVKWSHHKQNLGFVPIMIRMETKKAGVLILILQYKYYKIWGWFFTQFFCQICDKWISLSRSWDMFCNSMCVYILPLLHYQITLQTITTILHQLSVCLRSDGSRILSLSREYYHYAGSGQHSLKWKTLILLNNK